MHDRAAWAVGWLAIPIVLLGAPRDGDAHPRHRYVAPARRLRESNRAAPLPGFLQQLLGNQAALWANNPSVQQLLRGLTNTAVIPIPPARPVRSSHAPPPAPRRYTAVAPQVHAPPPAPSRPAPVARQAPPARPAARAPTGPFLWPSRAQYLKAVQSAANLHPSLQRGQLLRDARGFPMVASGSFSSAYRFRFPNGRNVAVRVFHPPPGAADRAKIDVWRARYQKLQRHLDSVRAPSEIVEVRWIDDGIRVDGRSLPVTVMPWAEARGLDAWIESSLGRGDTAKVLGRFAERWRRSMRDMRAAQLAHGDLHHGNVLVEPQTGFMRFIDYDAMWAPTLAGTVNLEVGHPNYQHPSYFHPQVRARPYGPDIDNFSALVIYVSIKALEHDGGLWQRFHRGDDHLVFTHDDLRDPAASAVFKALEGSPSNTVRELSRALARYCRGAPQSVPELERAIALATGGSAPPASSAPAAPPAAPWYQGR